MRIDRAGWPFITGPLVPAAVAVLAGRRWATRRVTGWVTWPLVGLSAYMTLFFRDPDRRCDTVAPGPDEVLSPADGMVMVAGEPQPGVAPEGDWQQVSVFLSVVDVHVNRSPYRGEVIQSSYRKGSFLAAYRKESAHRNERSELWLRDGDRTVVFRQIVGVLARRIVTRTGPGQRLAAGERMGLMKFGSRMDVFLPPECELTVTTGQRVRGGETVIARWPAAR
ncbi:MAG TPA: phosphatidylserine decarboxylase [Blastococcus sp.]